MTRHYSPSEHDIETIHWLIFDINERYFRVQLALLTLGPEIEKHAGLPGIFIIICKMFTLQIIFITQTGINHSPVTR